MAPLDPSQYSPSCLLSTPIIKDGGQATLSNANSVFIVLYPSLPKAVKQTAQKSGSSIEKGPRISFLHYTYILSHWKMIFWKQYNPSPLSRKWQGGDVAPHINLLPEASECLHGWASPALKALKPHSLLRCKRWQPEYA